MENLLPESAPRPLVDSVLEAIELLAGEVDHRQELLLFTDLAEKALPQEALEAIATALQENQDVRLYVVDVGVQEPINGAVTQLDLPQTRLRLGEPLRVDARVELTGMKESQVVELLIREPGGGYVKRGQRFVEPGPDGSATVRFEVADLPLGTHQGRVQLVASDPLEFDNSRSFTVEVSPPVRVLLLGQDPRRRGLPARSSCPLAAEHHGRGGVRVLGEDVRRGPPTPTSSPATCSALLDPPPLDEALWRRFVDAAQSGRGIAVFLGHRARPAEFNLPMPQQLLPGALVRRSRDATFLRPRLFDHPAMSGLKDYAEEIPWQVYPVLMHWQFEELFGDALRRRPLLRPRPPRSSNAPSVAAAC